MNYQDQNNELKKMYEERAKRNQEAHKKEQQVPFIIENQLKISPIENQQQNQNPQQKEQLRHDPNYQIYLNSCFYNKIKSNIFIRISTMFQDDPKSSIPIISQNIQSIFMSTFGYQSELIDPILKKKLPFVLLTHSDQKESSVHYNYSGQQNFTLIFKAKQKGGYGVFHAKLWLIKFKTFLRVVISSSNLHVFDFAAWQNAFWYKDFPLKKQQKQKQKQSQLLKDGNKQQFDFDKDFQNTLEHVLKSMIPKIYPIEKLGFSIKDYIYSDIPFVLIPSIPGSYQGNQIEKQGIGKIKNILKRIRKVDFKGQQPILTYNSTSLGKIQIQFCQNIYQSFCSNCSQKKEQEKPTQKAKQMKLTQRNFKLIYPTKKYIDQKTCQAASVLFLKKELFQESQIAKKIIYKYEPNPENRVQGSIPHLKTVIVSTEKSEQVILYIGSHNMTKAAWGTLFNKYKKKLNINNFQLGMLFPCYEKQQLMKWLPFQFPPKRYEQDDKPYFR